jgi:hypothetical protein
MRFRLILSIAVALSSVTLPKVDSAFAASTYPSAPVNVTQLAIPGGVRIGWESPLDSASGVTGYKVEYSTTGLSGSWNLASTLGSGIRSYDILGLAQVLTYVRVSATSSSGYGTYGYPWTKLYRTKTKTRNGNYIVYESGFGVASGDYAPDHGSQPFTRIRYRMEDSFTAGVLNYADVDFYKWASSGASADTTTSSTLPPTVTNLQVLSISTGGEIATNVTDMNVFSSIGNTSYYPNTISNGFGRVGRLEIWPWDYQPYVSGLKPVGDGSTYDGDDLNANIRSYGSFQVHDITSASSLNTIFAWNDHSVTNVDLGFGNGISPTVKATHEDWTFCGTTGSQCPQPNYFSLTIYINAPITPLVGNSTTSISSPYTGYKGVALSIIATSNLNGFYTFTSNGKKIAGCIKKSTVGSGPYTSTCTFKPSTKGFQQVTAIFSNIAAGYTGSQASTTLFISQRSTLR